MQEAKKGQEREPRIRGFVFPSGPLSDPNSSHIIADKARKITQYCNFVDKVGEHTIGHIRYSELVRMVGIHAQALQLAVADCEVA